MCVRTSRDGITEDLVTGFSKISGLFVIARNSAFVYKGQSKNVKDIGRELGVACLVEGSVRKAGEHVRITAQLIDASTGHHQWAKRATTGSSRTSSRSRTM